MTKYYSKFIALIALAILTATVHAAPETLTMDPQHSYVIFYINHLNFSTQTGKWYAQGNIVIDKDNPKNDKVNVTIPIANIVTGIPELDEHLKGKLFFDASQFPNATFVSNKVDVTGKDSAKVYGMLTVHGVSKPVVLNVKLNQTGTNPITNKMTAGFSADTTIKRSDFGMNTLLPQLGDDVKINIEVEAYKDAKQG